jgi:hypothetical protein
MESETEACERAGTSIRRSRIGFFAEANMNLLRLEHDEGGARGKNSRTLSSSRIIQP